MLPNAVRVIQAREHPSRSLLGAIDIVGVVPPSGSKQGVDDAVFGVAIWEGVDPAADAFSVFVMGLSEGVMVEPDAQEAYERDIQRKLAIQLKDSDDPEAKTALADTIASDKDLSIKDLTEPPAKDSEVVVKHKTIIIDFIRPGDERDLMEREIRPVAPPYSWNYVNDPMQWYHNHRGQQWLRDRVRGL